MKWRILVALSVVLLALPLSTCSSDNDAPAPIVLTTSQDKLSYAFGMNIGESLTQMGEDIKVEILIRGLQDVLAKRELLLTQTQAGEVIGEYSTRRRAEDEKLRAEQGEKNKVASQAFLAENAKQPGVITTGSGLQYTVQQEGGGPKPKPTDRVRVHYRGTLIDGKVFDSSYDRGEPVVFELNRVIVGWIEGIQLMSTGSKYKFFIPPALGYAESAPGEIGPNAVLIFEVELLGIEGSSN